jgi:hypothetical protein
MHPSDECSDVGSLIAVLPVLFDAMPDEVRRKFLMKYSCRDAFPKDKVTEAKALVDKGMGLKRNGKILSSLQSGGQRARLHPSSGG